MCFALESACWAVSKQMLQEVRCLQATCHDQRRGGAVVSTCWGFNVLSCNLLFFS